MQRKNYWSTQHKDMVMAVNRLSPLSCWNLSVAEREEYHRQKLLELLDWVSREVPFYQRLNLPLEEMRTFSLSDILNALPIVTKEMIQGRNPDFLAKQLLPGYWTRTGGSTGQPTDIYHDREMVKWAKESMAFARAWWGLKMGQRCFYVWGHGASLAPGWAGRKDRILRPIKDFLRNRRRVNAYRLDQDFLKLYGKQLIKFQPEMIIGYTSSIYLIAQRFLDDGQGPNDLLKLRGVIVTADPCYPFQAEVIQKAFGKPVIVEYGSVEVGIIAYNHPDGTFRVLEDRLIVETPEISGNMHEMIVTDLSARSQPFIKFCMSDQCTDLISVSKNGNGFRIIGKIEGRFLDSIIGYDGKRLHGVALSHIINVCYPGMLRYRFYQNSNGYLQIKLQLKPGGKKDESGETKLINYLKNELGNLMPIQLTYVESFKPTLSGKFRWVVSEMSPNQQITSSTDKP